MVTRTSCTACTAAGVKGLSVDIFNDISSWIEYRREVGPNNSSCHLDLSVLLLEFWSVGQNDNIDSRYQTSGGLVAGSEGKVERSWEKAA